MGRLTAMLVTVLLVAAACSSGDQPVATVDGFVIEQDAFDDLHHEPDDLDVDERVGTAVLLILRQAFVTGASADFGLIASSAEVDDALATQLERPGARGDLAEVLAAMNETEARFRVNAELDVVRDMVGRHLVTTESGGFDLEGAEQAYLLTNAEVCVRQIQLAEGAAVDDALARLGGGEPFDAVARDLSIDPFVSRETGVGAGGDLGCSAPNALPPGLDTGSLTAPLDEAVGPIASGVGVHVLEVYRRTEPDLVAEHDAVIEDAVAVQGPELFRLWAVTVLQDIEVEVDDRIGRWGILPESEPVPTVVPPYRLADIVER